MDISVVVPLYNEEDNVQLLYEEIKGVLDTMAEQAEIVFVDDGSRDRTLAKLEAIQAGDDHVRVVSLRRNFGQTAAMTAGFDHARGGIIITMDGDLQNDPHDIPQLVAKLNGATTWSPAGATTARTPFFRAGCPRSWPTGSSPG